MGGYLSPYFAVGGVSYLTSGHFEGYATTSDYWECEYCGEEFEHTVFRCEACGAWREDEDRVHYAYVCPWCGSLSSHDVKRCPGCGHRRYHGRRRDAVWF